MNLTQPHMYVDRNILIGKSSVYFVSLNRSDQLKNLLEQKSSGTMGIIYKLLCIRIQDTYKYLSLKISSLCLLGLGSDNGETKKGSNNFVNQIENIFTQQNQPNSGFLLVGCMVV